MRPFFWPAPALFLVLLSPGCGHAAPPTSPASSPGSVLVASTLTRVRDWLKSGSEPGTLALQDWQFHQGDLAQGASPQLDSSGWSVVRLNTEFGPENSIAWFRKSLILPDRIGGEPAAGQKVYLDLGVDDDGVVYVDGQQAQAFHWDGGHILLTSHAAPGEHHLIAVKAINGPGTGRLFKADLMVTGLPTPRSTAQDYLDSESFTTKVEAEEPGRAAALREQEVKAAEEIPSGSLASVDPGMLEARFRRAVNNLADPAARRLQDNLVGYAHTDIDWLWQWPETKQVWYQNGTTMLQLMEEFPDFHYSQSQAVMYRAMRQEHPDLFAGIQAAAKAGRWEPFNGWCENDMNMPSGESEIRQAILSNLWYQQNLGVSSSICWRPDSFGHAWTLPMILKSCGVDSYFFGRAGHGVPVFWWQSPDGSRILAFNTLDPEWYNMSVNPDTVALAVQRTQRVKEAQWLMVYGVGDHGGGPTRADINSAHRLDALPALPHVKLTTAAAFFQRLRKSEPKGGYPVISDENNPTFQGCYTSHVDTKRYNRELEHTLYSAEAWSSIAAVLGKPYPRDELHEAWYDTLRNQFHDILAGSNIHPSYEFAKERDRVALGRAREAQSGAWSAIERSVNTSGETGMPLIVCNPLGWERTDVVRVDLPSAMIPPGGLQIRDAAGMVTPASAIDRDGQTHVEFVAAAVPAVGYRVYWLQPVPTAPAASPIPLTGTLENEFFRVTFDSEKGVVTGILDKVHNRELIQPGGVADQMQVLWEGGGDAWTLGPIQSTTVAALAKPPVVETAPDGSQSLTITSAYDKSTLVHRLTLRPGIPRVDFDLDMNWQEQHTPTGGAFLKTDFETSMKQPQAWWEIPFGAINRPAGGEEEVGLKWIDVDEAVENVVQAPLASVDLSPYWNGDAFSTDANPKKGSFDQDGMSYPVGIIPPEERRTTTISGIPYALPDPSTTRNEVIAQGQTIRLPANGGGDLYFIGAASNGSAHGTLEVHFADGKSASVILPLSDWVVNTLGQQAAFTGAHRFTTAGPEADQPHLWLARVSTGRPGALRSITLPDDPHIHLFALTVGPQVRRRADFGVALLNDGRYGSDINEGRMRLSLIRSSGAPDPIFDVGQHSLRYSLYPHEGGWQSADVVRQAWNLNTPLEARLADRHPGPLPLAGSFLRVDGKAVVMTALKQSEDGQALIVRFYNASGDSTRAGVHFSFPAPVAEVRMADMKETPGQSLRLQGQSVEVPLGPWAAATVRMRF